MSKRRVVYVAAAVFIVMSLIYGGGSRIFALLPAAAAPTGAVAAQESLATILPDQQTLSGLYEKVSPSVVSIRVTTDAQPFALPGLPFEMPEGAPEAQGEGTGFIYDDQGHIVTNNHVVENAKEITVYFHNGMWAEAELVARDPQADLAVIQVTPPAGVNWQPLPLADPSNLKVGYYVMAIGSPFSLAETMTLGIVSALGRSFGVGGPTAGTGQYSLPDVIQTDAAINPGNSGGPLLNLLGEVVGVNFAINSTVGTNSGVGFAIPVAVVQKVVPALIEDGAFEYSYLGIAGRTIDHQMAEEADLAANALGVYVAEVVAGGPADKAGVQVDDVIVGIDGANVVAFEDLISYLFNQTAPGQTVTLELVRTGEAVSVELTLGDRPEPTEPEEQVETGGPISIGDAIAAAKQAVQDAELMTTIDSATAKQGERDGKDVWVVALTGEGKSATVYVDAVSGEVLELEVQ